MKRFQLKTRHFLTGEELTQEELKTLLGEAIALKADAKKGIFSHELAGKHLAMLFEKPSLRTRFSFAAAMQQLGGHVIESLSNTSKKEEPEDAIRVIAGYCQAAMCRTHEHSTIERMVSKSPIPIINGLSDTHHPCQVLADLMTLKEHFGELKGLEVAYVGDGNNMLHSLCLLLPFMGIRLKYACPKGYEPNSLIVKKAKSRAKESGGSIQAFDNPLDAVKGVNAIYTDVWTSMGFEGQETERDEAFTDYQVNENLLEKAAPTCMLMHCMPMVRGKEIAESLVESSRALWFQQSENRLHAQKALLIGLLG